MTIRASKAPTQVEMVRETMAEHEACSEVYAGVVFVAFLSAIMKFKWNGEGHPGRSITTYIETPEERVFIRFTTKKDTRPMTVTMWGNKKKDMVFTI